MDFLYNKLLVITHYRCKEAGLLLMLICMGVMFFVGLLVNVTVASALSLIVGFLGSSIWILRNA